MAKLSRGKTFTVVHKTHHSLENFRGASGPCHYALYTANDSRGKLSRLAKKPRKPLKFSPSKVLLYGIRYSGELFIAIGCMMQGLGKGPQLVSAASQNTRYIDMCVFNVQDL